MRKRSFLLTCFLVLLLLSTPHGIVAQSSYDDSIRAAKSELMHFEARLKTIDTCLKTYLDCDLYSRNYDECIERIDYLYESNKPMILENADLSKLWFNVRDLRKDIEEKMVDLKRMQEMEEQKKKLQEEFHQIALEYDQLATRFHLLGQMKKKAAHDTLKSLKCRETDLYNEYSINKTPNKDIIAQDPSLDSLCEHIETVHNTISHADIETNNWGEIVFKVTIMAAVLFFLINLIVSKKKLKNHMNGKKSKQIPSL